MRHDPGMPRRAKTAATAGGGAALKGLAIRDLTAPGFLPPPEGVDPQSEGGGTKTDNRTGDGTEPFPGAKDAAGEGEAAASTGQATENTKVKEICFNCWSKGNGQACTLHAGATAAAATGAGGGKAGGARPAESTLMCKNWDLGVMRRRYRAEELQVTRYGDTRRVGEKRVGVERSVEPWETIVVISFVEMFMGWFWVYVDGQ